MLCTCAQQVFALQFRSYLSCFVTWKTLKILRLL